jgi:hypothetical protein
MTSDLGVVVVGSDRAFLAELTFIERPAPVSLRPEIPGEMAADQRKEPNDGR